MSFILSLPEKLDIMSIMSCVFVGPSIVHWSRGTATATIADDDLGRCNGASPFKGSHMFCAAEFRPTIAICPIGIRMDVDTLGVLIPRASEQHQEMPLISATDRRGDRRS